MKCFISKFILSILIISALISLESVSNIVEIKKLSKLNQEILHNYKYLSINENEKNYNKNIRNKTNDEISNIENANDSANDDNNIIKPQEKLKNSDHKFNSSEIVAMISFYIITVLIIIITILFINQKI